MLIGGESVGAWTLSVRLPNWANGAGGVTGTNYLGEIAKPDGLMLGYFTSQFFNILTADPNLRVDLAKFAYIASIEGVAVAYARKDFPPGIQEAKDIIKAKGLKAGGLSLNSAKDVRFRLQLDILGVPHQYVTGYNSNSDARLALERNEIQFFTEGTPGYRSQVQPRMVKEGVVMPLYADELVTVDGEFRPSAEVPDIPSFSQLHQQIFGKLGSGGLWGKGFQEGTQGQLRFLPVAHNDFIFSVLAEEQGLAGVLVALGLYFFVIMRALDAARLAKDRLGAYLVLGVLSSFTFQVIYNITMSAGLAPVKGLTLPLMSYGGSSLIATLAGFGLILNVRMRRFTN